MNIVIENVDLVIGSVIATLTALGGAILVWKKVFYGKDEDQPVNPHLHDDCLVLARQAKEQIVLLEQKVHGEQHIRLNRLESDVEDLFEKMDKTLDLIIAQLERNSNGS